MLGSGSYNNSGNGWGFTINVPETPTVRSAIIEVTGVSYNTSGSQTITVDLERGIDSAGACTSPITGCVQTYTLPASSNPKRFTISYDAWQGGGNTPLGNIAAAATDYSYTLYVKGTATGGQYSLFAAKLILSYDGSTTVSNQLKMTETFIHQELASTSSGTEVSKSFSLNLPEQSPSIKSAFIEITAVAKGSSSTATVGDDVKVNPPGSPSYNNATLDLGGGSTETTKFTRLLDASSVVIDSYFPGYQNYTFYYKGTNYTTNVVSARIYVTYKYTNTGTGYVTSGQIISSVYDTGVSQGAAFNSVYWQGSLGSPPGVVKFQLATSDCSNGKTNPPTCNDSGAWSYLGSNCTSGTYYQDNPNTPQEVGCASNHDNKRYVRYKLIICSNDCVTAGTATPQVDDVVVNLSK